MAANNPPNMSVKPKNYQNVYQFCVSLKSIKPRIWRRILVPENYNFRELHLAVNNSMGWNNTHLHQFEIKNPVTGKEEVIGVKQDGLDDFFLRTIDERTTKISDYFVTPKDKAKYLYDFGATWQHEVVFQKIIPANAKKEYPICVAGKRACPREDYCSPECSDLSDSENEQESDVAYDPEKFDPKEVRFHDSE